MIASNPFQSCRRSKDFSIYTALKHANLTYKKAQIHTVAKQRQERIKQFRKANKLVFVDETSILMLKSLDKIQLLTSEKKKVNLSKGFLHFEFILCYLFFF